MAFTLFDLMLECYKRLGQARFGVVDSGSTTTIVDAMRGSQYDSGVSDDDYLDCGIGIVYDAAGASAAPEGEFSVVSAFDSSTGAFTFDEISTAPAADDKYFYTTALFPFMDAIENANSAMRSIGDVENVDTTTLTTDATHTEYSVAVGWKRQIYRVDYQGNTSDENDNDWQPVVDWEYIPAAGGTAGKLILPKLPDGVYLRVCYMAPHPHLYNHDDVINESIDPEYAIYATMSQMVEAYVSRLGDSAMDTIWPQKLADARNQMLKYELTRPVPKHRKKSNVWILSDNSGSDDNDDMSVYLASS